MDLSLHGQQKMPRTDSSGRDLKQKPANTDQGKRQMRTMPACNIFSGSQAGSLILMAQHQTLAAKPTLKQSPSLNAKT